MKGELASHFMEEQTGCSVVDMHMGLMCAYLCSRVHISVCDVFEFSLKII